jgi:hypothetical protein
MIVMGHTTGTFSRLEELNYTPALIVFLAAALLTIFSWRRADALNTLTIRATQPLPEGEADSRS